MRRHTRALAIGFLAAAALTASLGLTVAFRAALAVGFRTPVTQALYPWTVWAELGVLVALGALVISLTRPMPGARLTRPRLTLAAFALLALLAGAIRPLDALVVLAVFAATTWLAPRLSAAESHVVTVTLAALGLRILAALLMGGYAHFVDRDAAVFDDEIAYHHAAVQLANILATGFGDLDFEWRNLAGHHLDLVGVSYLLLGVDFVPVRLLNALVGALAVPIAYRVAAATLNERAAVAAAWIVAVWPLLVVWGGSGLREPLVIFLALLLAWLVVRPHESRADAVLRLLAAALCLLALGTLRPLVAFACVGALTVAALAGAIRSHRPVAAIGLAVLGVALSLGLTSLGAGFDRGGSLGDQLTPRAIEYRLAAAELTPLLKRDERQLSVAPAGLAFPLGTVVRVQVPGAPGLRTAILYWYDDEPARYRVRFADGSTLSLPPASVQALTDETIGWREVAERWVSSLGILFGPSLLGSEPGRRWATLPDTLAWDALVLLATVGVVRSIRNHASATWLLCVAYSALVLLALSLTSTNLGTAMRHRSTLVPWLAVLASPVLVALWLRLQDRMTARSSRSTDRGLAILGSGAPQA